MTERQIIKKFIVRTFDCSGYFFELVWKQIKNAYGKSADLNTWRSGLSVLYDTTRTDKQYDAAKAAAILYEAIKEVEKTGKAGEFLSLLEAAGRKHKAEEELKLKMLKNIESVTKEISSLLKSAALEGRQEAYKDDTLELSLNELGKPVVKINGRKITIKERFFTDLAFLAACKIKRQDKWVDIRKDLMWTERHIKDYPTDFKETLERGTYLKPVPRDSILERLKGQGKVKLGVFKPSSIIIRENLSNFISEHYWTVKKAIDDISYDLSCQKASGRKIDPQTTAHAIKNQEINLEKIDTQELKPMLRHTFVILQAVSLMGWKFHNADWFKEWRSLLRKCEKIYELAAGTIYEDTKQYLHHYIILFSRTA